MGIISTMTHRMRNNRLSKRLSISSSKLEDEDSNDLIKPTETTCLTRPSVESTTTIVRHSFHETLSSDPPKKLHLQTNMNMHTLFDKTPVSPGDRSAGAFSNPEYPVFKLDMCEAPFETPKSLQGPMQTGDWRDQSTSIKNGYYKSSDCSSITAVEEPKKEKRSMKTLWKRHCGLNIPRSSLSLKTSSSSPKWLDSAGVGDEEALVDMKNEKLLEVHLQNRKKSNKGSFRTPWS
ncbi:hypothetical protein N7541_008084 [Penicillium brevicompactum]|uniref:Uncharacterized protein n=1 Tax=Penicillium brevicompactum TaxID=5074 RepID=A0A9W9QYE2_PENBR|nr:hypothetical protein N7541_008084 [Penicillium brevicompactum]